MKEHWSLGDSPTESAYGNEIEYVYLVVRDHVGNRDCEILGVHETEESARSHAKVADTAGETTLRKQKLEQEDND